MKGTAAFSFYATKNLCTGEGGMLVTDDAHIADYARMLITHGMSRNAWNRYSKGGAWQYDVEEPGFKYNMFDIQAALGLVQLSRMEEMQKRREQIAMKYNEAFKKIDTLQIPSMASCTTTNNWHLYVLHIKPELLGIGRNQFIEELYNRNIGTSVHFIPVHLMSAYRKRFGCSEGDYPNAEAWFKGIISLPLYSSMKDDDVEDVVHAVADIANMYHV